MTISVPACAEANTVLSSKRDLRGSDLFRRITLSSTDDNFTPKEGKPPLSPDQVKRIELWIAGGASGTASLDSIKGAPAGSESSMRAGVGMASIFRNLEHGEEIRVTACKAPALRKESNDDKADDEIENESAPDGELQGAVLQCSGSVTSSEARR